MFCFLISVGMGELYIFLYVSYGHTFQEADLSEILLLLCAVLLLDPEQRGLALDPRTQPAVTLPRGDFRKCLKTFLNVSPGVVW